MYVQAHELTLIMQRYYSAR